MDRTKRFRKALERAGATEGMKVYFWPENDAVRAWEGGRRVCCRYQHYRRMSSGMLAPVEGGGEVVLPRADSEIRSILRRADADTRYFKCLWRRDPARKGRLCYSLEEVDREVFLRWAERRMSVAA